MLYFSKLRIFTVLFFTLLISYFTVANFLKFDNDSFNRKLNLGLDLQGGSYLLLEIDNNPVFIQKLQSKVIEIKKFFKGKKISIKNINLNNNEIIFQVSETNVDKVKKLLDDDDSEINPYFQKYKSHQFDININQNSFILVLSNTEQVFDDNNGYY